VRQRKRQATIYAYQQKLKISFPAHDTSVVYVMTII
jgi:hypothetical protein